ncbi:MAG: hypothetical protein LBQ54_14275 [Planctomycetaceae bacterium]|jgi:hypothetical protein|nr:hypothetical protein [Planctomycetaceae bacterium]
MTKTLKTFTAGLNLLILLSVTSWTAIAEEPVSEEPVNTVSNDAAEYLLRYQFHKGDILKWDVTQQIDMETQVATEQNQTNTFSRSTKVWTVMDVDESGTATLEYSVENAEINNKAVTRNTPPGEKPIRKEESASYNSKKTEEEPNPFFNEVARSIGIPLAHITIDPRGKLLKKIQKAPYAAAAEENRIAIPMPEKPIKVGETWDVPNEIVLPQPGGIVQKIAVRERFTLEKVQNGIATIRYKTIRLTPVNDPKLKMRLIDKEPNGIIFFDITSGRNIEQQIDIRQNVINWTERTASRAAYQCRMTEKHLK